MQLYHTFQRKSNCSYKKLISVLLRLSVGFWVCLGNSLTACDCVCVAFSGNGNGINAKSAEENKVNGKVDG